MIKPKEEGIITLYEDDSNNPSYAVIRDPETTRPVFYKLVPLGNEDIIEMFGGIGPATS